MLKGCVGVCRVSLCVRHGSSSAEKWTSVSPWLADVHALAAAEHGGRVHFAGEACSVEAGPPYRALYPLHPVSAFGTGGSEGPHIIGRERTGDWV